jgi:hypothetical protein
MNNLQEREFDGVVAEGADNVEASSAIKSWLNEQDALRPFGIGWAAHRRLEAELTYLGFTNVSVSKMEAHPIFVVKGNNGTSRCCSHGNLAQVFRKLGREIGFQFRAADTAVSFSRGRFQVVLCLPDESAPTEIVPALNEDEEIEHI